MTFGYYARSASQAAAGGMQGSSTAAAGGSQNRLGAVLQNLAAQTAAQAAQQATAGKQPSVAAGQGSQPGSGISGGQAPLGQLPPAGSDPAGSGTAGNQATLGQVLAMLAQERSEGSDPAGTGGDTGSGELPPGMGLAGGAGIATAGIVAMGGAALMANKRLNDLANSTLAVNQVLEEYNGTIAAANARAEAAGIRRATELGEDIGPGYAMLSDAQSEYRDIVTDYTGPLQNLGLVITARIAEFRNDLLRSIGPFMDTVGEAADMISRWLGADPDGAGLTGGRAFLSDVSDGKFDGFGTQFMNPRDQPLLGKDDRRDVFGIGRKRPNMRGKGRQP